jgi:rRNA maturation endonuclease Nob1
MNIAAKFCLILFSLSLVACDKAATTQESKKAIEPAKTTETKKDASPVTKSTDNKTYTNEFFQMTVQKPEGWYAQNEEEAAAGQKEGGKMLAGNDKNLKAAMDAAQDTTSQLFGFFEVPRGTPGKLNPNVLSAAENIKAAPGVKTGCDYIALTKEIIKKSQVSYQFEEKCETKTVNGTEFGVINAQLTIGDQVVKQRYYAVIRGHHAISVIETFFDAASEAKVNKVVESLKFS